MRVPKLATNHVAILLLMVLVICLASMVSLANPTATSGDASESVTKATTVETRRGFKLPQFFDFEWYTKKFNKSYKSVTDFLVRKKIYLGQLIGIFVSLVSYKNGQSTYYLKVNEMSDWLPTERREIYSNSRLGTVDGEISYLPEVKVKRRHKRPQNGSVDAQGSVAKTNVDDDEHPPVADLEQIENEFENIVANADKSPAYRAIAKELHVEGSNQRRKREVRTRSAKRRLTIEQLATGDADELADKPHRKEVRPESNNPNYEPPEVTTFGVDDIKNESPGIMQKWIDYAMNIPTIQMATIEMKKYMDIFWYKLPEVTGGDPNVKVVWPTDIDKQRKSKGSSETYDKSRSNKNDRGGEDDDDDYYEEEIDEGFVDAEEDLEDLTDVVFVDHRDTGCFLEAKSQGQCGSCYIFAIMSLLEYQHCISTGELVDFSEQYVLDCGKERIGMGGCDGGTEWDTVQFTNFYGLEIKRNFPYLKKEDKCPYPWSMVHTDMGYLRTTEQHMIRVPDNSLDYYLRKFPIHCVIHTASEFHSYGGGVHNPKEACRKDHFHAIILVGAGREDGIEYYLLRNSHSVHFGEHGYYKLAKESREHCLMPNKYHTISGINSQRPLVSHKNRLYQRSHIQQAYKKKMAALLDDFDIPMNSVNGVAKNEFDRGTA